MDTATTIQLAPLIDVAASLLLALLLGLGVFAIQRGLAWLKLSEDEKIRGYLEAAMRNGVTFALHKARERIGAGATVDVRNEVVAGAANYVIERVPDALKRFGVTEDGVRDMVLARINPGVLVPPPAAAPAPPAP
jgi:hypothetical protein